MKYLKISLMAFALGLFMVSDATAQTDEAPSDQTVLTASKKDRKAKMAKKKENQSPEKRAQKQTDKLTTHLDLTEEQAEKVQVINFKYANQAEVERSQRKALMSERELEIKEVLTAEQAVKMDEKTAKMKEKRKGKRGKRGQGRDARKANDDLQED